MKNLISSDDGSFIHQICYFIDGIPEIENGLAEKHWAFHNEARNYFFEKVETQVWAGVGNVSYFAGYALMIETGL